ncbi:sulfite exporter TauE/SafE family protein [Vibrio hippocampi]|uniref:Probable membrane transporter protein n=1 Tax=Vibrio hippocampi TaxID=654686 RepID=A0ABN8DNY1_9VIBR|nr:sulfite exporter TauE/SafE family protein [Vibrio hippocampi]CAH0530113.1 hypothetical protein VHP8226_03832 [Vibrio hippocampi]
MLSTLVIIITLAIAGFIRGYTGFGFSALVILVLSAIYPVAQMVPAVLLVDLIVTLPLVASSWKQTDFSALSPLLITTMIGIPCGYWLLFNLPDIALKLLVPSTVLALAIISRSHSVVLMRVARSPLLCGFMSGWTTSAVSAGGAPVVIYMRYSQLDIHSQKNSLISYFFLTTCFAVGSSFAMTQQWYLLPDYPLLYTVIAGIAVLIGKACYQYRSLPSLHHAAYYLLLILSVISMSRVIWTLFS